MFQRIQAFINLLLSKVGYRISKLHVKRDDFSFIDFRGGSSQKAFSLVVIGAHSGEKSFNLVQRAAQRGKVCLAEQVLSLMVQLRQCFRDVDNVIFVEGAFLPKKITEMD